MKSDPVVCCVLRRRDLGGDLFPFGKWYFNDRCLDLGWDLTGAVELKPTPKRSQPLQKMTTADDNLGAVA